VKRLLPLLFLLGCPVAPGDDDDSAAPTPMPLPDLAELSPACGQEHAYLPRESVGEVVAVEELPDVSLSAEEIRVALALAGFPVERLEPRYDVEVSRFRYVTQDRGELVEATSLIAVPDLAGEAPVVAWLHPLAGYNDSCSLSDRGLEGAAGPLLLASLGHAVIGPDYLGMNGFGEPSGRIHPGLIGEPSAIATLDALRAGFPLVNELRPALTPEPRYALFGASEGGFTGLWADRWAGWYLPEYELVSVVASVPPPDLRGIAQEAMEEWQVASAAVAAMLVVHADWYGLNPDWDAVFPDDLQPRIVELLQTGCTGGDLDDIDTFEEAFTPEFRQALLDWDAPALAPFSCTLNEGVVAGAAVPRLSDAPVLMVTGELDDLALAGPAHDAIEPLCDEGYVIEHIQCAQASHVEAPANTLIEQWQWMQDRFDGLPMTGTTCVVDEPRVCEPLTR
jgi:hypothetical protein